MKKGVDKGKREWYYSQAVREDNAASGRQQSEEQKDLEKLGSMLGYLDVDMQLNALDYYLEQLKESSLRATEVSKTQKKLYQSMGILGGAALAVLVF